MEDKIKLYLDARKELMRLKKINNWRNYDRLADAMDIIWRELSDKDRARVNDILGYKEWEREH